MRNYRLFIFLFVIIAMLSACPAKKEGAVEGTVVPPGAGVRITAVLDGKAVSTAEADAQNGRFRIALAPGKYDINVTTPATPFPMTFPGVIVEPGRTTTLPLIELAPALGNAVLSGRISPGGSETRITLLYEGRERAAIYTDPEGKYEFAGLSPGNYTVHASSPGYANDASVINLAQDQKAAQNLRLLYISTIDGVDWTAGKIRAMGVGLPPKNAPNATIRRELAKRAALADGQRNLLKIIEQIKVAPNQSIKSSLPAKDYTQKIQGFVQGYRLVSENETNDGKIELELELPLTGSDGLSHMLEF